MDSGTIVHFSALTLFTTFCLLSDVAEAMPIDPEYNEGWRLPCGPGTFSPPPSDIPPLTNDQKMDKLNIILAGFDEAQIRINILKDNYNVERVRGKTSGNLCSFDNDLDNILMHVPGFPEVTLSQHGSILELCENMSQPLLEDYAKLVRVMILLEHTIIEENFYVRGQYSPDLGSLYSSIKGVMCNFHTLHDQCGETQRDLNATDIVQQYQNSAFSTYQRGPRDYLLVKDAYILLQVMSVKYKSCSSILRRY